MALNGTANGSAPVHTPFYAKLQEWILRQQEYEATHDRPAPLTKVQGKLLLGLEQTIAPEPDTPEPQVGDTNWVGKLLEYHAVNQEYASDEPKFTECAAPDRPPSLPIRWICVVKIEEAPTPFPGAAWGLGANGTQPSFAKKKDAKQYAAKCAVDWLRANNHMPANGVRFPRSVHTPRRQASSSSSPPSPVLVAAASAAAKRQRISPPAPAASTPRSHATTAAQNGSRTSPTSSVSSTPLLPHSMAPSALQAGEETSPFDANERSATYEVDELCKRLGYQTPKYIMTQDQLHKASQEFWSGRAEFELPFTATKLRIPPTAGVVENALGKKNAKHQIAEGLVPHLKRAVEEREARIQEFMREGAPGAAGSPSATAAAATAAASV